MNSVSKKRLLEGLILLAGGLIGLIFVWYGHLILRKATLAQAILGSLIALSCILAGLTSLTLKHDHARWFIVDSAQLTRGQNILLAIGGLIFAICSLWLAVTRDIPTLGGVGGKLVLVVGFFYFGFHAFRNFKRAFRAPRK